MPSDSSLPQFVVVCACGCGEPTRISVHRNTRSGIERMQPYPYVVHHNGGRKQAIDRFMAKVDKTQTCWQWTGGKMSAGYGTFFFRGGMTLAHRVSYELHIGTIPAGLQIDHLCRNRACVNPAHLEAVTQQENIRRGFADRRAARAGGEAA